MSCFSGFWKTSPLFHKWERPVDTPVGAPLVEVMFHISSRTICRQLRKAMSEAPDTPGKTSREWFSYRCSGDPMKQSGLRKPAVKDYIIDF